jgi:NRAMP (natural resistance-associated macrophage protein)-like metal ion transporter
MKQKTKKKDFWHMLGPGLTTGAADDDPSGIATYSQAGSSYGYNLLWMALFTLPFMAVIQEMCARIGLVTGRGLAANIKTHYPRWVLYMCAALLFAANSFNLGADLGAMAKAVQLLLPGANFGLLVIAFALVSLVLQIFTTYEKYARYLKWLTVALFAYVLSALLINLDWTQIVKSTLLPKAIVSRDYVFMVTAILGTTISPYLFFWQTSQEVEEQILEGKTTVRSRAAETTADDVRGMRVDVWSGMAVSNAVMFFIIAACAGTLFLSGHGEIKTAADAAEALRPLAGDAAYFLFALGIIGTGLLAVPVLAGSASYAIAESFGWREGLYRKLKQAQSFYGVIIAAMVVGLIINFTNLDPIRALLYSAIANAIVAPIVVILIIRLSSNKKIMGSWVSGHLAQIIGWVIALLMAACAIATLYYLIF